MQAALHAATATLPHLRKGLTARNAERAVPNLRALMGAAAIALADTRAVLAIDGEGREQVRPGDLLSRLLERADDNKVHIVPRLVSSDPTCPLRSAVLAPLIAQGKRVGTLIAFYRTVGRPSHHELRVVQEAASLVSAEVELSLVSATGGARGPGGAAGAAGADLAALHLQRAGGGGGRHPRAAGGGARPPDRLRRVHPLPVPRRPLVRHLGRGDRPRRALPPTRAGALPGQPARDDRRPTRDARHGRPGHVGAAAGRECGAPRGGAASRDADGWRSRLVPSAATSSCGSPTTASGSRPSASRPCWPARAAASACRTSTRGCAPRSASGTRCGSSPTSGRGRPR